MKETARLMSGHAGPFACTRRAPVPFRASRPRSHPVTLAPRARIAAAWDRSRHRGTVIRDTRSFRHRRAGARGPPMSSRPHLPSAAVDYPSSDGKPLAENDLQARAILYAFGALRVRYRERRSDVYVSADLLMYYEEGNPRVSVAPDVFVVFGVEDHAADELQGVGGRQGAGLRAGGGVAEHVGGGRGEEARHLRESGGAGVLPVRPDGRSTYTPRLAGVPVDGRWVRAIGRPWSPSTAR